MSDAPTKAEQKERLSAGYASTSKKQRLAVQSIAEHIRTKADDPEEAAKWLKVQAELLVNLATINTLHEQHQKLYGQGKDDEDTQ